MNKDYDVLSAAFKMSRQQRLADIQSDQTWDIVIIGGGITGAGILKLASQLKLKVLLVEQKDFAWGSSSRSSKMVHGGLRYMAQGQMKLTLESVKERQTLLNEAPDLVVSKSFVMSHYKGQFPWPWLFNQLLVIYDTFAGIKQHRFWPKTTYQSLVPNVKEEDLLGGTQFADALTEDARLVQRLIQESLLLGGQAVNYVKVDNLLKSGGVVTGVRVEDTETANKFNIKAKVVINATGAWSDSFIADNDTPPFKMRPLRGSHLILPSWRLPVASVISILHPVDKRPVQIYPWQNVTVVGTTDVEHSDDINLEPKISQQEFDYLLACVDHQFPAAKITQHDIVSTFSGIRPVIDNGGLLSPSKEKREHGIWQSAGLITVAGGKLTTFKLIAQQVLSKVSKVLNIDDAVLERPIFESYEIKDIKFSIKDLRLPPNIQKQINACYGVLTKEFIMQAITPSIKNNNKGDLGLTLSYSRHLWAELIWAVKYEQIVHLDDLLLRRTRLGNVLPNGAIDYIAEIRILCCEYLSWDEVKWQNEITRYVNIWQKNYSLPYTAAINIEDEQK